MSELDSALDALAGTAAEWHGGLSNHGPMCAEGMHVLGHDDAIASWVARYRPRLEAGPETERMPIVAARWVDALGDVSRIGDWNAHFDRELSDHEPDDVLRRWVPRLAPGLMAAATHGPIRVAHAARALAEVVTEPRRRELAAALAYWAARYQAVAAVPRADGRLTPLEALARIPLVPSHERRASLIFDQVKEVDHLAGFDEAVNAVEDFGRAASADDALDTIVDGAARAYLACARRTEIAFVHTITGPAALRLLLPFFPDEEARRVAVAHAWVVVAAITAAYAAGPPLGGTVETESTSWPELADAAIADGDEHTIKLVEACRREHARSASPALLAAAQKVTRLIKPATAS